MTAPATAVLAALAASAPAAPRAEPPRVARGTTGAIEVASATPIRAKAVRDAASPVLVRVNPAGAGAYRVEFIGSVEGTFDLAPFIERADGRAAEGLPDLRVEVYSQLPPNHGTDVFGLGAGGFSIAAHYTQALAAIAAAWCAVPAYFIARRVLRRRPLPPPPEPRAPTVAERLFRIVDEARARELDAAERGRLELLLLRELRGGQDGGLAGDATQPSLADAVAALRLDARTAEVVRAVESWLHAPSAGDRARALDAIDRLRAEPRTEAPR